VGGDVRAARPYPPRSTAGGGRARPDHSGRTVSKQCNQEDCAELRARGARLPCPGCELRSINHPRRTSLNRAGGASRLERGRRGRICVGGQQRSLAASCRTQLTSTLVALTSTHTSLLRAAPRLRPLSRIHQLKPTPSIHRIPRHRVCTLVSRWVIHGSVVQHALQSRGRAGRSAEMRRCGE
jgi:hypothetical protein